VNSSAPASASAPPIPWQGVLGLFRSYSGRGSIYPALAAVADAESEWTSSDVRRRARLVLFQYCLPQLRQWPGSNLGWLDALPAQTRKTRIITHSPRGRVNWAATRKLGWPPEAFVTHSRHRQADELLVTTLAWTLKRLAAVHTDAVHVVPGIDAPVEAQLRIARQVLAMEPVSLAVPRSPTRAELAALRATGRPWSGLAAVASLLLLEDSGIEKLAHELIAPDAELRWRLFHLGCYGLVLLTVNELGFATRPLRPIGLGTGPTHAFEDNMGRNWDLWFEAGAMWSHYATRSPYLDLAQRLPAGASQPLGADIALICRGTQALLIECKYSPDPTYVTRNGYHQAVTYMTEVRSRLTPEVHSCVIGPGGVIPNSTWTETHSGRVSLGSPGLIPSAVHDALRTETSKVEPHFPSPEGATVSISTPGGWHGSRDISETSRSATDRSTTGA
jgi:hypothetical protein